MNPLNQAAKGIFDFLIHSKIDGFKSVLASCIEGLLNILNNFASNFWTDPITEAILNSVARAGIVVFIFSLLFLISDVGIQFDSVEAKTVFVTISKAILYVFTIRYLGVLIFSLSDLFVENFAYDIEISAIYQVVEILGGSLFMLVIVFIIGVIFTFLCIYRFACMLVHLISSVLYIPFIVRGDTQKITEWVTIAVSISVTYAIQFVAMYISLSLIFSNHQMMGLIFVTMSICAGPALKQFGYQTGAKSGINGVGRAAMATARAAKLLF